MIKHDILILGGGASGVFLALLLADCGKDVAILEGKDRILKKLLTTGNGRCNITNAQVMENIPDRYTSANKDYRFSPLEIFPLEDTLGYFQSLGLSFTTLEEGKMYPLSLQSSSVVDLLRLALEERQVPVYLQEKVQSIVKKDQFLVTTSTERYSANTVVVATGGMAAPGTGSDGSMLKLLKGLGHRIIKPEPALVQLKLESPLLRGLSGVKIQGEATLSLEGQPLRKEAGELLFTDYGISGPPILQLSRFLHPHLEEHKNLTVTLDLFPDFSAEEMKAMVLDQVATFSYRTTMDTFRSILPNKLIPLILKEAGIERPSTVTGEVPPARFLALASLLKAWTFPVTGTQGFNMAQGTYGGVDTLDIKETLESRKVPGLYFTGEVLDVLGACGGFNLQWAWSTAGTVMKALTRS